MTIRPSDISALILLLGSIAGAVIYITDTSIWPNKNAQAGQK